MKKHLRTNMLITAAVMLLIGLALIIWPEASQKILVYVIGAAGIVYGIVISILHYRAEKMFTFDASFLNGIVFILVGLVFLIKAQSIVNLLITLLGLAVVMDGFVKLQSALKMHSFSLPRWKAYLITSIVILLVGVLMIINPFGSAKVFTIITGAMLVVDAICWLWGIFELRGNFIDD